jgi:hypothetical protein
MENRTLGRKVLLEYDIDDDKMSSVDQELNSIAPDVQALNPQFDFSSVESAQNSVDNSEICQIGDDVDGFVSRRFGQKIKEMFPDKAQEVIKTMSGYISKFIDYLSSLNLSNLKSLVKSLKSKIKGDEVVSEEIIKEFFGTSMTLVTIGSFTMPALVLTIASWVIVGLVTLWLLKAILCSFNINITTKKKCRVRSFSWGQCN